MRILRISGRALNKNMVAHGRAQVFHGSARNSPRAARNSPSGFALGAISLALGELLYDLDRTHVGKMFKAPRGMGVAEGTLLTVRTIVVDGVNKLYLARDAEKFPEYDDDDDQMLPGAEKEYIKAKMALGADRARKLVAQL